MLTLKTSLIALLLTGLINCAYAESPIVPDPAKTPGEVLTTDAEQICQPGYSKKTRNVPQEVKEQAYKNYGIYNRKPNEYEVDHLISLELGGANTIKNLWPESFITQPLNAHVKDELENKLHALICSHQLSVEQAQQAIAHDWIAAYKQYVGSLPGELSEKTANTEASNTTRVQPDQDGNCQDAAPIKISKNGIYHIKGENNYEKTKAKSCFATTAEAETAGFRAPK